MLKEWILNHFTYPLKYKHIVWKDNVKIYCDGGAPVFRWMPRFLFGIFNQHWKLKAFEMFWLGREVFFVFGKDVNGCFKDG